MRRWNKIILKTPNIIAEEMSTADGSPYCPESTIKEVISSIPTSIEDGREMFTDDRNVISFENGVLEKNDGKELINLDNLVNAGDRFSNGMFDSSSITSFVGDLTSLETAHSMFYSSDIQSFVSYTPKLTNGPLMFYGCSNLTDFCGDLSTIKNGQSMFYDCYNLRFNNIDLSSLEDGEMMFYGCELGEKEVSDIVKTFGDSDVHLTLDNTPRIDIGVTKEGLKSFYDETGFISFGEFAHEYNGKLFYVYAPQNINSIDDLNYGVIEYSDEDGSIVSITYPENYWEEVEDISGLFIGDTQITDFGEVCGKSDLPTVKYARGTFYGSTTLTSFDTKMSNLKTGFYMFGNCSSLKTVDVSFKNCEELQSAFHKCEMLESFSGDLSNLKNGHYCFYNCSGLINFSPRSLENLERASYMFYFNNSLPSFNFKTPKLKYGNYMLAGTAITEFIGDLSSLENGNHMFYADNQMTVFEVPHMNSLTNAEYMFYNTYIEDFDTEMNSLESAEFMFYQATKLKSFKSPLPSLKYGKSMFYASNKMESFDVDLPLLEDGENMFRTSKLKSFVSDTHSLKNGNYMFSNTVLETVDMDLSSLERGSRMFNYCKLSGESVRNIYETLPQIKQNYWSTKDGYAVLDIGINSVYSSTASTNLSRLNAFAVSAGFSDWQSLKAAFNAKGWTMGWYYSASTKIIEV